MTAPTSIPLPADLQVPTDQPVQDQPACDVCPHPAAAHDVIGRRFCDATVLGALSRGCICRVG